MRMENQWLEVYELEGGEMKEAMKRNDEYYNNISSKDYQTIERCVRHALKEGNHAAFAHYYFDIAKRNGQLFQEKLNRYIKEAEQKNGVRKEEEIKIVKSDCWRDRHFSPEKISREKGIVYTSNQINNWKSGKSLPNKDSIVQLGLWYGFSFQQVEELLVSAGEQRLYILDLHDVIAMYYLDYYAEGYDSDKSQLEKVQKVKEVMNRQLNKLYEQRNERKGELIKEILISDKKDTKKLVYSEVVVDGGSGEEEKYKEHLWNIEKEYETLYKEYGFELEGEDREGITTLWEDEFRKCRTEEELQEYIESKQERFQLKRLGYLKQMIEALKDIESYKKNGVYTDYVLDGEDMPSKEEVLAVLDSSNTVENKDLKFISEFHKRLFDKKNNANSKSAYVKAFDYIWKLKNAMREEDYENLSSAELRQPTERAKVNHMLYGRERTEKTKGEKYYEYDLGNKVNVIKFALTTGQDDKICDFLEKSGFWTDEMMACVENEQEDEEGRILFDKLDMALIYMLRYRERLMEKWIEQWAEEEDKGERIRLRKNIKKVFPTIRLVMTINRDIQLSTLFEHEKSWGFKEKTPNLVFPVSEEKRIENMESKVDIWFDEYSQHNQKLETKKGYDGVEIL